LGREYYKPYYPLLLNTISSSITHFLRQTKSPKCVKVSRTVKTSKKKTVLLKERHFRVSEMSLKDRRASSFPVPFTAVSLLSVRRSGRAHSNEAQCDGSSPGSAVRKRENQYPHKNNKRSGSRSVVVPLIRRYMSDLSSRFRAWCLSSWHSAPSLRSLPLHSLLTLFTQLFASFFLPSSLFSPPPPLHRAAPISAPAALSHAESSLLIGWQGCLSTPRSALFGLSHCGSNSLDHPRSCFFFRILVAE